MADKAFKENAQKCIWLITRSNSHNIYFAKEVNRAVVGVWILPNGLGWGRSWMHTIDEKCELKEILYSEFRVSGGRMYPTGISDDGNTISFTSDSVYGFGSVKTINF